MEVIIKATQEEACRLGARIVAEVVRTRPHPVLGLATGSSPLPLYRELVRLHREEGLSFAHATTFNLDEYVGLDPAHPGSFRTCMEENLFRHIDLPRDRAHLPDGLAKDIPAHCAEYERMIAAAGGIDLQLLGIGSDGHLAFNEPSSSFRSRTRIKTLWTETRRANAGPFGSPEQVPHHCLTMGLGTIMEARRCLLLGFGRGKAQAIRDMVEGPVTASCPASLLQFHEHTIVLVDEEAGSLLQHRDYYREVYAGKPDWQRWE